MAKKFLLDRNVNWIDPDDTLSKDQWLACHLVFLNFLNGLEGAQELDREDVQAYMDQAYFLIKESFSDPDASNFTETLISTNAALHRLYDDVVQDDSLTSEVILCVYFRILEQMAQKSKDVLGNNTFTEYFDDIMLDKTGYVYSEKAKDLVKECTISIKDINGVIYKDFVEPNEDVDLVVIDPSEDKLFEFNSEAESDKSVYNDSLYVSLIDYGSENIMRYFEEIHDTLDDQEKLLQIYRNSWKEAKLDLKGKTYEIALCIHLVCLDLCGLCLETKRYLKYQKSVTKAITAYKEAQNQKLREFSLRNANDAFAKLKENVLLWIEQDYDDDNEDSLNMDYFTLATDLCVLTLNDKGSTEYAQNIIENVSLNEDNVYSSEEIISIADMYYGVGDIMFDDICKAFNYGEECEENEEDDDSERDEDNESVM